MERKYLQLIFICVGVLLLQACSIKNEGAIDFRKTTNQCSTCAINKNSEDCEKVAEVSSLKFKNTSMGTDSEINQGELVSVYLKTAFIKDFYEISFDSTKNGEIAIIADVKEFDKNIEIDFTSKKEGRLVFYSDDVYPSQFLNFSNMPIYGPKIYEGKPFLLKFAIFEMDVSSNKTKSLLDQLANMGSQAYAPASPILSMLNSLGQSFLGAKGDDTLFKYVAVANDKKGSHLVNHFTLDVGNYVLIRKEDRSKQIDWENIVLNSNEGRLYKKDTGELYKDETYLVIEINKNVSDTSIDMRNIEYQAFLNELKSRDNLDEDSNKSIELFKQAIDQKKNLKYYYDLLNKIEQLKDTSIELPKREDIAELIIEITAKSIEDNTKKSTTVKLNDNQIDSIISKIRENRADKTSHAYQLFKKENFVKAITTASDEDKEKSILVQLKEQMAYDKSHITKGK